MSIIPIVSPTAGDNADGFVDSAVLQTSLAASMETVENCNAADFKAYRLDRTSGALQIVDVTVDALSGNANQFKPFGTSAQFSDGDEFIIACDEDVQAMLFKVDTAAVHNATMTVYDSTDGIWATNSIAFTDESTAFKTTGWHYILLPDNASRVAWKPSSDPTLAIPLKKYYRVRLDGVVGGNTPPQLSEITLIRKTFRWQDHTADDNGSTTVAPAAHQHYPWTGSIKTWAFDNIAYRIEVYMHLTQTNVISDTHEYLASDNAWKPMTGWSNSTNDFTVGPGVLGNPVQQLPITWNIPSDWASKAQTFILSDGSSVTKTGYWIRERTTGVTSYGEHNNPLYRLRARQFGNANTTGQEIFSAKTLLGVSIIGMTEKNTATMECEVVNLSTGKASAFTVPANPTLPLNINVTDLAFAEGDKRGTRCVSGGTAKAVQIEYAY